MGKEIRVVVIPVDGEMEVKLINGDYEQYQELVGGYVRVIEKVLVDCTLCVDEEAIFNHKRINFRASNLYGINAIYGDAVLTNLGMISDDERDFVSLDDEDIIKLMSKLHTSCVKGFSVTDCIKTESIKGHRVFVIGGIGNSSASRQLANAMIQGNLVNISLPEIPKIEFPQVNLDSLMNMVPLESETDNFTEHSFKAFGGINKKNMHRRKK